MNKFFNTLMVLALALCVGGIPGLLVLVCAEPADTDHAPVYVPAGDGTLRQVGVYTNRRVGGYEVLACFAVDPNPRVVRCLVHSYEDQAAFFIEVPASEGST